MLLESACELMPLSTRKYKLKRLAKFSTKYKAQEVGKVFNQASALCPCRWNVWDDSVNTVVMPPAAPELLPDPAAGEKPVFGSLSDLYTSHKP